jgi:hypothetical protein
MPLFAGSGAWRKFYLGLVNSVTDLWGRVTSGNLGVSTSGTAWRAIRGVWSSNNGVATTSDSPSNYSIAAVLLPSPAVTLTANNVTLGTGLSFWVKDAANWTGTAGIETDTYYTYTYSCNCQPYTYYVSCNCTPYTYYTSCNCATNGPYPYSYTVSCCAACDHPINYYNTYSHTVYSYSVTHYNCSYTASGNYYTYSCQTCGPFQGQSCQACGPYQGQSCSTCNGTGTTVNYILQLWQSVAGTVSMLTSSALSALIRSIQVITGRGSNPSISVTAYSDNTQTTSVGSISTSGTTSVTGNLHGIIIIPSTQNQGNTLGAFSVTSN